VKKTLRGMILLLLSIALLLGQTLAANAVPRRILNCRDSVVRIFAAYDDGWYSGSGFVVKQETDRTIIATNYHVVEGNPYEIEVYIGGDASAQAKVLASDKKRDLCLLAFRSPVRLAPMTLAAGRAEQGDAVYALGYPAAADAFSDTELHSGEEVTITDGIISAVRTATIENNGPAVKLLQISAAINGGNSGGPLFNEKGQVIGINTYGLDDAQGIFAAIEVGELLDFMKQNGIVNNGMPIWVWFAVGAGVIIVGAFVLLLLKKKKTLNFVEEDTQKEERILARKAKLKKTAKIIGWTAACLAAVVVLVVGAYFVTYRMAVSKAEQGDFAGAEKLLLVPAVTEWHDEKLDDYISAGLLLESEDFVEAKKQFEKLVGYRNAEELTKECDYLYAGWLVNEGQYSEAILIYEQLDGFKESDVLQVEIEEKDKNARYMLACEYLSGGKWENAVELFQPLANKKYKDSREKLFDAKYNYGCFLYEQGLYAMVVNQLKPCLVKYPNAQEIIDASLLSLAKNSWKEENIIETIGYLSEMKNKSSGAELISLIREEVYDLAVFSFSVKDFNRVTIGERIYSESEMYKAFSLIHPYKDSGYYLEQLR